MKIAFLLLALCGNAGATNYGTQAPVGIYQSAGQDSPVYTIAPQFQNTVANMENGELLFVNLATNTVSMRFSQLVLDTPYTKTANNTYRFYLSTVVSSSGTAIQPVTNGYGVASQMQVFANPTASSTGTLVAVYSVGTNSNSLVVPFTINLSTGTRMMVTGLSTAASTMSFTASWTEKAP